jgi:phage gpG-like protein
MAVQFNVDVSEVDRALADIEERGKRMRPAFRELRRPMRQDQREHARGETGPDGRWPPRAAATEERRRARNKRVRVTKAMRMISPKKIRAPTTPKQLLGRLPAAMLVVAGDLLVRATSRVGWSGIHWRGGRAGHGGKVRIPRREFYWLSDLLLRTASDVLGDYVIKGWKR